MTEELPLAKLRKEYGNLTLDIDAAPSDPFVLFSSWFDEAKRNSVGEANAMAIATVGKDGAPSVRMMLLKDFSQQGFSFFTNYGSRKAHELAENSRAALVFYWEAQDRQVRAEGVVQKVSADESDAYYKLRPIGARLGAWASSQSSVIPNAAWLDRRYAEVESQMRSGDVPRPEYWGGYRLNPTVVEFMQCRVNRLHHRVRYSLIADGSWKKEQLSP